MLTKISMELIQYMFFFGFTNIFAGDVLLHHVLVKSGHHDANKHATQKMLEKIIPRSPIPYEHIGIPAFMNFLHHVGQGSGAFPWR